MKRLLTTAAAVALLAPGMAFADAHGGYTIGVSNTVQGNG